MHRQRMRKQWERRLALFFTSLFGWTFAVSPTAIGLAESHNTQMANSHSGYRTLSPKEMRAIRGSQHALSLSAASGPSYAWEGSYGRQQTDSTLRIA